MARAATEHCQAVVAEAQARGACCFSNNAAEKRQLARMAKRQELVCPVPGLYADAALWSRLKPDQKALMTIRGLARKHPSWVFCDMSAALVHGLWVSYKDLDAIHVAARHTHAKAPDSPIVWHKADCDFVEIDGVRVTTLERTVFDCCRLHPVRACLGVADSALRMTGRDNAWLKFVFDGFGPRFKGHRVASYVASIANGLSENGGESLARATMIMLGYEVPELQVELPNIIDSGTYRADFLWRLPDGTLVAGELDGRDKYVVPEMTGGREAVDVLADERLRESHINALRIPVMRFSLADVNSKRRFCRLLDAFGIPRVAQRERGAYVPAWLYPNVEQVRLGNYTFEVLVEYAVAA